MTYLKLSYIAYTKDPDTQAEINRRLSNAAENFFSGFLPLGQANTTDQYLEASSNLVDVDMLPENAEDESASDDDRLAILLNIYRAISKSMELDISLKVVWVFPDADSHEEYYPLGNKPSARFALYTLQTTIEALLVIQRSAENSHEVQSFFSKATFKAITTLAKAAENGSYPSVDRV